VNLGNLRVALHERREKLLRVPKAVGEVGLTCVAQAVPQTFALVGG